MLLSYLVYLSAGFSNDVNPIFSSFRFSSVYWFASIGDPDVKVEESRRKILIKYSSFRINGIIN
jgi:hypothetical protein